ncbi:ABC transporter substrate-binding protein [Streptomyces sp. PSKA54]|uniref:ABC transporter substrate-binding protein n=1 Tax=Streptomyces himalayensis subsp. aureolus TaxID=2758039 RepID=A0A7W2D4G7_9ACTN|nr:ABC transporter substrate-binding protein [Streptomyces himalayensis]MBA4864588.1 ABC transporter substrate-binding protein [Streptomyces himalayensis subsp. aureolus]
MRRRTTRALIAALAAMLALVASACGTGGPSTVGDDNKVIRIGAWYPLTGALASFGIPEKAGVDAYFKSVNARGGINGRKIEWIVKDNAFDPQQTVQIARRLVDQDGVVAIVATNGTAQSQATFPFVLEQKKVPVLNTLGGDASWYEPAREGLFGLQTLYEDQAAALGDWVARDGAKKVLVVHSDPAAFVNVAKQIGPAARKTDPSVQVKRLTVKFQTTDYSPVISKVKAQKPDAVVLILAAAEAASYLKEARLQGLSTPMYGYAPVAAQSTLTLAGKAAEGLKAVQLVKSPHDDDPAVKEFREAMAKYEPGQPADFITLWGWEAAKAFVEIAKTIEGPVTAESLTKAYQNARHVDTGVGPVLNFSTDHHLGTRDVQKVVVRNGRWESQGDFFTPPSRG